MWVEPKLREAVAQFNATNERYRIESFYAGLRFAEDTARIIQNRTQTWLSEQELLARR
jgi:hypothetical protein